MEAQNGAARVCKPVVRRFTSFYEEQDPDPHQSEKWDLDYHQSVKRYPDPYPFESDSDYGTQNSEPNLVLQPFLYKFLFFHVS